MTSWHVVIATPIMPFAPAQTEQEQRVLRLVDTILSHDGAVTIVAPRTQTNSARAGHLLARSKFLLRPVIPTEDPRRREIITNWIEPPTHGPGRFFLDHPWFSLLDRNQLPVTHTHLNLSTAWALWTSAFFSLLAQLNTEITIIHALDWQTALVPAMARCMFGCVSSSVSVFSPGTHLPPDELKPEVRTLLRLPQEAPSPATSLLAWSLTYASAWDISPQEYQRLATDPLLNTLLERYRTECLLPFNLHDPAPEMLEHPTIARYARVLAVAHSREPAGILSRATLD